MPVIIIIIHIGPEDTRVAYKLSNGKIQNVNEECGVGVGFDDTIKADNHIFSITR